MLGISFFGIDFLRCVGRVKEGWRSSSKSAEAADLEGVAGGRSEGGGGGASDGGGAGGCIMVRREG